MYQSFDLTGKTCLITGGSRGIGYAMADALAMAGADVVLWANHQKSLSRARENLKKHGRQVWARLVDVSVEQDVIAAMEELSTCCPHLDGVIASAGIGPRQGKISDVTSSDFTSVFNVNLNGTVWTLREACKILTKQARAGRPGGSLVGFASLAGRFGAPYYQAYASSKAAVEALMKTIAVEMARYGVRANAVMPGWIATDMTLPFQSDPAIADRFISRIPMRRWGRPEELGGLAIYLMSDASSYHSGDTIVLDGAYSAC